MSEQNQQPAQEQAPAPSNNVVATLSATPNTTPTTSWSKELLQGEYAAYADSPVLQKYVSPQEALKALVHANEKLGSMIPLPKPDASDADKAEFYKKLGVPDKPDAYNFDGVQFPEGLQADENITKAFKQWALEAKLTPDAAKTIYQKYAQMQGEQMAQQQAAVARSYEATVRELKMQWGADFDKKVNQASYVVQNHMPEGLAQLMRSNPMLANNPDVVKFLSWVGEKVVADEALIANNGANDGSSGRLHPSQALAQIDMLKADKEFMATYLKRDEAALKRMANLYAQAHPVKK